MSNTITLDRCQNWGALFHGVPANKESLLFPFLWFLELLFKFANLNSLLCALRTHLRVHSLKLPACVSVALLHWALCYALILQSLWTLQLWALCLRKFSYTNKKCLIWYQIVWNTKKSIKISNFMTCITEEDSDRVNSYTCIVKMKLRPLNCMEEFETNGQS